MNEIEHRFNLFCSEFSECFYLKMLVLLFDHPLFLFYYFFRIVVNCIILVSFFLYYFYIRSVVLISVNIASFIYI